METNIKYLLDYCCQIPELYNKVSTKLWVQFGIRNAERGTKYVMHLHGKRMEETI